MKKEINQFVCGFAAALITACNLYPEAQPICRYTIEDSGYTIDHFKQAGLDQDDIEALEKIMAA